MSSIDRRSLLMSAAGLGAAGVLGSEGTADDVDGPVATNGRIRQSLVYWCYNWTWPDIHDFCKAAVRLGCPSIELLPPKHWPTLKEHGLTCAIASAGHTFKQGPNHRENWNVVRERLTESVSACAEHGIELDLRDRNELVGRMRLRNVARSAHHRRTARRLEQSGFRGIGHRASAVGAGERQRQRHGVRPGRGGESRYRCLALGLDRGVLGHVTHIRQQGLGKGGKVARRVEGRVR